jgi:hypothetical protein
MVPIAKEYDHSYLVWIALFYIITFIYVGKSTLHIGMGLLAFLYCVSWIFFYKWVSSKNGFALAFDDIRKYFDNLDQTISIFLFLFFILFFITISILFFYGRPQLPNSNDSWILVDVILSILIALVGFLLVCVKNNKLVWLTNSLMYGFCAIFIGIVVWNLVNLGKVTAVINKRSELVGTFNMGNGNLSKGSLTLTTWFLVLFYFAVAFLMAMVYFSMNEFKSNKGIVISFFGAIIITAINHFLTKKITQKVPNETIPMKEKKTSNAKIQNQNIFSNAYYSILRFFNSPDF